MREHHIEVRKTARYYALGDPATDVRTVGFFCHGYRQLAGRFLSQLARLDNGHRLLVAPEGLHRFYAGEAMGFHDKNSRIVASWMTYEDREYEIRDYVDYMDRVYEEVFKAVDRDAVRVVAVGFSQGAATVARWVAAGKARIDRTVLWGGIVPPDINVEAFRANIGGSVSVVIGKKDEYITPELAGKAEKKMKAANIPYDLIGFEGGHHFDLKVMESLLSGETTKG